jgi:hypothetical protein
MMAQSIQLAKRPHVIVGTPGRVVDHLTNTKVRIDLSLGSRWTREPSALVGSPYSVRADKGYALPAMRRAFPCEH